MEGFWLIHSAIKELSMSIENLVNLKQLILSYCNKLKLLPNTICKLYHLKVLSIHNCSKLNIFLEIEEPMENLMEINLNMIAIKELPRSIENLVNLKRLSLYNCEELKLLPNTICKLYHLKVLSIDNCSKLNIFPEIEEPMENLMEVYLKRIAIKELPSSIENLVNLKQLALYKCEELKLLPNTICKLYHLNSLAIDNCSKLNIFPEIEEPMENLMRLNLQRIAIKELPSSIENLVNLRELLLLNCKELQRLPDTICKLYHLARLSLLNCSKLKILPRIPSVRFLDAIGCISLEEVLEQQLWFDQSIANFSVSAKQHEMDYLRHGEVQMCWPGHEIPGWFNYQNKKSSLSVKLCLNSFEIKFLGIAFCAVVDFSAPGHFERFELCCQAHCDGAPNGVLFSRIYQCWADRLESPGDHVFMRCDKSCREDFIKKLKEYKANQNGGCSSISVNFNFSFTSKSRKLNLEVKNCGVYLLYAKDAEKFGIKIGEKDGLRSTSTLGCNGKILA